MDSVTKENTIDVSLD